MNTVAGLELSILAENIVYPAFLCPGTLNKAERFPELCFLIDLQQWQASDQRKLQYHVVAGLTAIEVTLFLTFPDEPEKARNRL
ncbi:hypothetical protein [Endozoicomonas elysicola]|uniref:hypothetical protein n=1 Tax=Endozoicomonas elysicola TaxID=305900 RepID=UPI0012F8C70B|nr:hypothetical protein [Endozoicomonas elysicola]